METNKNNKSKKGKKIAIFGGIGAGLVAIIGIAILISQSFSAINLSSSEPAETFDGYLLSSQVNSLPIIDDKDGNGQEFSYEIVSNDKQHRSIINLAYNLADIDGWQTFKQDLGYFYNSVAIPSIENITFQAKAINDNAQVEIDYGSAPIKGKSKNKQVNFEIANDKFNTFSSDLNTYQPDYFRFNVLDGDIEIKEVKIIYASSYQSVYSKVDATYSNGSVTGLGTYKHGANVSLSATPDVGYSFGGWYDNETLLSLQSDYIFTMPDHDLNLTAKFVINSYKVIVTMDDKDPKGTTEGSGTYHYNEAVTLKATPLRGCEFVGWFKGETLVTSDNPYIFKMSESDVILQAVFRYQKYTVNLTSDPFVGMLSGGGTYEINEEVTISEGCVRGYEFIGWYENDQLISSDSTYTFLMGSESRDIVARYQLVSNEVVVTQNIASAGNVTGAGTYKYDSIVTIEANCNPGYSFLGFYDNLDVQIGSRSPYVFIMDDEPHQIIAKFEINKHGVSVTKNIENGGTITGDGEHEYNSTVHLSTTVNKGYEFLGWYLNGHLKSSELTYSFVMPDEPIIIEAQYKATFNTVTINSNLENAGTITGAGNYEYNDIVDLDVKPNTGYEFIGWYENDILKSDQRKYSFAMGPESMIIEARFKKIESSVILESNYREAVLQGKGHYKYGEKVTVSVKMAPDATFYGWTDNGELVSTDLVYTFEMGLYDYWLKAIFIFNEHQVTIKTNNPDYGKVNSEDSGMYPSHTDVGIKADANYGYEFEGWTIEGTGKFIVASAYDSYEVPENNVTFIAIFEPTRWYLDVSAYNNDESRYYDVDVKGYGISTKLTVSYNEPITLEVKNYDKNKYYIEGWYDDNYNWMTTDEIYSFNMPKKDLNLHATFGKYIRVWTYILRSSTGSGTVSDSVKVKNGVPVTITATPDEESTFGGWVNENGTPLNIPQTATTSFVPTKDMNVYAKFISKNPYAKTTILNFGSYPQTEVHDAGLIKELNRKAGSPKGSKWTTVLTPGRTSSIDYYIIDLIGDDGNKYRGVYYDEYIYSFSGDMSELNGRSQERNGYYKDKVYYFKYEPLQWKILNDERLAATTKVIDAKPFGETDCIFIHNDIIINSNTYEFSCLRDYLINDVYNLAFTDEEKLKIETTLVTITPENACRPIDPKTLTTPTNDKIFALSRLDIKQYETKRHDQILYSATDYAKCVGALELTSQNKEFSNYWLRTPSYETEAALNYNASDPDLGCGGVRPALVFKPYQ